jgi:hypothetical protein
MPSGTLRRRSRSRSSAATPWTSSSAQKAGISDFSRKEAGMPPTEIGPLQDRSRSGAPIGQVRGARPASGQQEGEARRCRPGLRRAPTAGVEDVDPHVGVDQQRVAGAQHEQGGVHVEHALVQEDELMPKT